MVTRLALSRTPGSTPRVVAAAAIVRVVDLAARAAVGTAAAPVVDSPPRPVPVVLPPASG
jgi:hypothetical protein